MFQEAAARIEEYKKSIEAKMALRQSNLNPERPGVITVKLKIDVSFNIKLDCSDFMLHSDSTK